VVPQRRSLEGVGARTSNCPAAHTLTSLQTDWPGSSWYSFAPLQGLQMVSFAPEQGCATKLPRPQVEAGVHARHTRSPLVDGAVTSNSPAGKQGDQVVVQEVKNEN
jgi:hypothetical protein